MDSDFISRAFRQQPSADHSSVRRNQSTLSVRHPPRQERENSIAARAGSRMVGRGEEIEILADDRRETFENGA